MQRHPPLCFKNIIFIISTLNKILCFEKLLWHNINIFYELRFKLSCVFNGTVRHLKMNLIKVLTVSNNEIWDEVNPHPFYATKIEDGGGYRLPSCRSFWNSVLNFNFANNFWRVGARALILHLIISGDNSFLHNHIRTFFILWPCPSSLAYFSKTLTLIITFQ